MAHREACMTDGPPEILPLSRLPSLRITPRRLPYRRHDTAVAHPRAPRGSDEGMPESMKGGVAHAGSMACPLKRMRHAGSMMARIQKTGSACQEVTWVPLRKTHGQRTYLVAVLRAVVNVWCSVMHCPALASIALDVKRSARL
jgi:hypothetical protein